MTQRAIVAYAARCARRVQPLYRSENNRLVKDVDKAICVAEGFARGDAAAYLTSAAAARDAARDAAHAAAHAARAAAAAARAAAGYDVGDAFAASATDAAHAAHAAISDAAEVGDIITPATVVDAIRRDYDYLASRHPKPEDLFGKPIDPSENGPLGPLWPEGEPESFKRREPNDSQDSGNDCEPLEFLLDSGDATAEEIAEVFCEMSNLYEMMGGRGVQFTVTDCREPVVQEEPV